MHFTTLASVLCDDILPLHAHVIPLGGGGVITFWVGGFGWDMTKAVGARMWCRHGGK